MEEQKVFKTNNQSVFLENRQKVSITDVKDVDHFNEETVRLATSKGGIVVKGSNLHIQKLDLEDGKVIINGTINGINYTEKEEKKEKSLLGKILK